MLSFCNEFLPIVNTSQYRLVYTLKSLEKPARELKLEKDKITQIQGLYQKYPIEEIDRVNCVKEISYRCLPNMLYLSHHRPISNRSIQVYISIGNAKHICAKSMNRVSEIYRKSCAVMITFLRCFDEHLR